MGAKDGKTKKDKLTLEEFKADPRIAVPSFPENPRFNTFDDAATEDWHHAILNRGLEGEFILLPDNTIMGLGRCLSFKFERSSS